MCVYCSNQGCWKAKASQRIEVEGNVITVHKLMGAVRRPVCVRGEGQLRLCDNRLSSAQAQGVSACQAFIRPV